MSLKKSMFGILFAVLFLVVACDLPFSSDDGGAGLTEEAKLAALWLSNEPVVPEDLAHELQEKFSRLRAEYEDEIPNVNIKFRYPYDPKFILISMDYSYRFQFMSGDYHEWDELNKKYGVSQIVINETSSMPTGLIFRDQVNTYVLSEMYEELEGINSASASGYDGDWPNTYPWIVDGEIAFLVRWAGGDCESGCIENHFWYFKSSGDEIELIGDFWLYDSFPEWWDEIKCAFYKYRHHGDPDCD